MYFQSFVSKHIVSQGRGIVSFCIIFSLLLAQGGAVIVAGAQTPDSSLGTTTESSTITEAAIVPEENDSVTSITTGDASAESSVETGTNTNLISEGQSTSSSDTLMATSTHDSLLEVATTSATTSSDTTTTGTSTSLVPDEGTEVIVDTTSTSTIVNNATTTANTGVNEIQNATSTTATSTATSTAVIDTGDAAASTNIINVANVNVFDSNGMIMLLNSLSGMTGNVDLRDALSGITFESFCGEGCDGTSTPLSALISNNSTSTIDNNIVVGAQTGNNGISGPGTDGTIMTGDAYAAANVVNMANTNIVDSNYLLFVFNGLGNMINGDFILPSAGFFSNFFSGSSGSSMSGQSTPAVLSSTTDLDIQNENSSIINNSVDVHAGTGDNSVSSEMGSTTASSSIVTGDAQSGTNIFNETNSNLVGGGSFMVLFRVFGKWSGNVLNTPDGIQWKETPHGVELVGDVPSVLDSSETDSSDQNISISNNNSSSVTNNIEVYALTGDNKITDKTGNSEIETGDAYATANVVNITNTNIVGRNWILAIINIFGDWGGNISFGQPDLWVAGEVESPGKITRGSELKYTFTITNKGDAPAHDVVLKNVFDSPYVYFGERSTDVPNNMSDWNIGTLAPQQTVTVEKVATVDTGLPRGSTPVSSEISVQGNETDANTVDNSDVISFVASGPSSSRGGSRPRETKMPLPILLVSTTNDALTTPLMATASSSVNYTITIENNGDTSYNSILTNTLKDSSGGIVSQEQWNLEMIAPREEVSVSYTAIFGTSTPPGVYTNYAQVVASSSEQLGQSVVSNVATSAVVILSPEVFNAGFSFATTTPVLSTENIEPLAGAISDSNIVDSSPDATAVEKIDTIVNNQVANVGSAWNFVVSPYWLIFPILGLISLALLKKKGSVRQFARMRNKFTVW